ncbi:MAG: hypothetical protein HFJ41_00915 [Clostridia bacterium]|nr:hypothetical protein [Clostridia bacterium]
MSDYKMNPYDLQSYFKSLCNSFYIAYEQVKRLEKEEDDLRESYNEEDLEMVNNLLKISVADSTQNKYIIYKNSREELEEEKERLQVEEQKIEELGKIRGYWANHMWQDFEAIKSVIYTIKDNGFSIIVTTKAEIYALIRFYYSCDVKNYPIINIEEEYREVFPNGEELYDDFIFAYEEAIKENGIPDTMSSLYEKYF